MGYKADIEVYCWLNHPGEYHNQLYILSACGFNSIHDPFYLAS